jgi:hypothetical protein
MIKAAAEIAITPATAPPATAPTLEELVDLDEGVEVAVGDLVEAMGWEDSVAEDHGVFSLWLGPVSGVSEGIGEL